MSFKACAKKCIQHKYNKTSVIAKKQQNNFMQMQIPRKTNNNAIELIIVDFRIIKTIVGSFEQKYRYMN